MPDISETMVAFTLRSNLMHKGLREGDLCTLYTNRSISKIHDNRPLAVQSAVQCLEGCPFSQYGGFSTASHVAFYLLQEMGNTA